MRREGVVRAVMFLSVLAPAARGTAADAPEYRVSRSADDAAARSGLLRLQYGTFDPRASDAPGARTAAPAIAERLKAVETRAYIVQFTTAAREAYRDELRGLGARVFQFLPDEAYIVHM